MKKQKNLTLYFIFTYLLFWVLLGAGGVLISKGIPEIFQNIIMIVVSWTPTFVILLMFKRLYPGTRLRDYFASNFLLKAKLRDFAVPFVLQFGVILAVVLCYLSINDITLKSLPIISAASILPAFIISLTSGAMGEELGWRGYALKVYQKKYSPLISSIFVGLIWGFWHLPLWIISGYSGLDLVLYSMAFVVAIISMSVVITYFYNRSGNILIAMWMHFLFNFTLQLVIIDLLQLIVYFSIAYLILAIVLVASRKHELLKKAVAILIKE